MKDKLIDLELKKRTAIYMASYQPKRELYWNQIAKDFQYKINKLKKEMK